MATKPEIETMAGHLSKVTCKEQMILCNVIRTCSGEQRYDGITPALLPFVSMKVVRYSLAMTTASRPIAVLIAKLKPNRNINILKLWLDNKKVARVFGGNPSRGRRFNWLPAHQVNGKPLDPLVKLHFVAAAKGGDPKASSIFSVETHECYQEAVQAWLCDNLT